MSWPSAGVQGQEMTGAQGVSEGVSSGMLWAVSRREQEAEGNALHPAWVGGEPGTLPSDCSRDSKMLIFVATLKP